MRLMHLCDLCVCCVIRNEQRTTNNKPYKPLHERIKMEEEQLHEFPVLLNNNEVITLFLNKENMEKASQGKNNILIYFDSHTHLVYKYRLDVSFNYCVFHRLSIFAKPCG